MIFAEVLKIILYIIAGAAAFCLLLIAAVCICPICYRLTALVNDDKTFTLRIKALTGMISFCFLYRNKDSRAELKIFGKPLNKKKSAAEEPDKEKKKESGKEKKPEKGRKLKNIRKYAGLITENENRAVLRKALCTVLKIFKHILPRSYEGRLTIGMETPDKTAILYPVVSYLNAAVGSDILIIPDMDKKNLDADAYAKGHIIPGYLLVLAVRFITDKNIRHFIKKVREK